MEIRHYITTDNDGGIMRGFTDFFEQPQESDILLRIVDCEHAAEYIHFQLFADSEPNIPLLSLHGMPLYSWDGQTVHAKTEIERELIASTDAFIAGAHSLLNGHKTLEAMGTYIIGMDIVPANVLDGDPHLCDSRIVPVLIYTIQQLTKRIEKLERGK